MVSLKCSNCLKVKRCAMVRTRDGIEYLCGLCRRQLGYAYTVCAGRERQVRATWSAYIETVKALATVVVARFELWSEVVEVRWR